MSSKQGETGFSALVKNTAQQFAALAGVLSFLGGFISDVLQPLAPVAHYLFAGGLGVGLALLVVAGLVSSVRGTVLPIAIVSTCTGIVAGLLSLIQLGWEDNFERGVLASQFPAVASLQDTLGIVQRDVAEIKETTQRIEDKTDTVLTKLEGISAAFSNLTEQGGVIPEPKTPEQFYHNARLYELKGDYGNARRAYLGYFRFNLEYLDPHLRFQQFLKVQEGRAGARETYQDLTRASKGQVPKLASVLLWNRELRAKKLQAFIDANPDVAPAYYLLSKDFSLVRLGQQSLADKRREKALLDRFIALDEEGQLVRWFIDQQLVAEWREDATNRLAALRGSEVARKNPLTVSWTPTNSGWMGALQIAEPVAEIFWKKPRTAKFVSTGFSSVRNVHTGKVQPNYTVTIPLRAKKQKVAFKYQNTNGENMGPFEVMFNPKLSNLAYGKQILKSTQRNWVSFRDYNGKTLVYFTNLLGQRGVLSSIRYGIDQETPDTEYTFPPYKKPGFAPISGDAKIYMEVPGDTQYMTVRVSYKDGTKSEVIRIDR